MESYEHLKQLCISEICNPKKLFQHCMNVIAKCPKLFAGEDWKTMHNLCTAILNDPNHKNNADTITCYDLLPGAEEMKFRMIDDAYSKLVTENGILTVDLDRSDVHFLNMDLGFERLNYPYLRVLGAENYVHIQEMCSLLLNQRTLKDHYRKYHKIENAYDLDKVTPLELKVIILATKTQ